METKENQIAWVEEQLRKHKRVTRNQALRQYITRLAALVGRLRERGWEIEGEKEGRDYVYVLKTTNKA